MDQQKDAELARDASPPSQEVRESRSAAMSPDTGSLGKGDLTTDSGPASSQDLRRAHPRHPVDLDVGLFSESNFYAGFTENLSAGGVFIATHRLMPVGSQVEFILHLPTSELPVRGTGEVRWVREYSERSTGAPGMGVRFTAIAPEALISIERFLKHRDPIFYDDPE